MKTDNNETVFSDHSLKAAGRKPKSRDVSSRFLSPTSTPSSPNQAPSPVCRKPGNHRSQEGSGGFIRGLWPSSTSQTSNKKLGTLADHLGNDRLKDLLGDDKNDEKSTKKNLFNLSRQRSCTEFSRFENEKEKENAKENHRPILGGSMRYTGRLRFPGKKSSSNSNSNSCASSPSTVIAPGRLSVDENALSRRKSDYFRDTLDSESECSEICSDTNFGSPATRNSCSRKSGKEVSSKYLNDLSTRHRRGTSDSNISNPVSSDNSPKFNKFNIKNAIKRANSLTGYGSAMSQWALSPGRSSSPPMSLENKGKLMSFSSMKPPSSPSRTKGVDKLLNLGLDLFKSKKSSSSSPLGESGSTMESVHQFRMLHNRLLQWLYANARAKAVNENITTQAETNLLYAWEGLTKLQHSVVQKKLQLEKEKLQVKLNHVLHSQIKPLEAWGDMERQHLSAVSMTKECVHSVVCKIPLIEGAKMDPQSSYIALRHASDLTASIKSTLNTFSPSAEKTVSLLSELAEVVAHEKLLLEQCLELCRAVSLLEIQERSLKCNVIQLQEWQQQQPRQLQQQPPEISS